MKKIGTVTDGIEFMKNVFTFQLVEYWTVTALLTHIDNRFHEATQCLLFNV